MQVILKQNVPGFGRKGEVKSVKDGFFQNYLLPKNLAVVATPAKIAEAERNKKQVVVQQEMVRERAQEIQEKMKGLKITLKAKARGDTLYGSIGEKEILQALEEKINVRLEPRHLLLSEHIKVVGSYEMRIQLMEGVEARFALEVKPEK